MTTRREFLRIQDTGAIAAPVVEIPGQRWYARAVERIDTWRARFRRAETVIAPSPEPVVEAVEAAAVAAADSYIATVLSPSQVRAFTDCQVRWLYKYILDLPERRSSALGLGTAFHDAIGQNFREKIESKADLPADVVTGLFRASWSHQLDTDVVLTADEDVADLTEMGAAMVETYMHQVAPLVQPAAVELPVMGEIGGVKVKGKIDVLTVDGTIIDSKTASKKPAGVAPDYRFQVATYVQLHAGATKARVDTITKTKTINIVQQSVQIGAADRAQTARMYPLVQEAMRNGLYVPNRGSNLCSRKHCSFWERCEAEYGGCVDER